MLRICLLIMQVDILKKKMKTNTSYLITDVWNEIENEIITINGGKKNDYREDYTKILFNSNDELRLSKPLKFYKMTMVIRFVFKEDGKLYPQLLLNEALCEECKNEI